MTIAKDIRNDASHENARLIVENAKLREIIQYQQERIQLIEEIALNENYKNILDVIHVMRNNRKGEKYHGIYT